MTKNTNCRKERIIFLLPFLAVFFLICCQKEPTVTFGQGFVQNNANAIVVVVDTLSVNLSTIYLDSVASAGTGTALVGNYQDNQFGVINSRSFFQVAPASIPIIDNNAGYDSIALIMRINKAYYGDTTQPVSYKVNQLTSQIILPYLQNTFYSNSTFPTDPTYLGSVGNIVVYPTAAYTTLFENDTIRMKMSDALGQQLFNMLRDQSDTVKIASTFLQYFKGLCVSPLDPTPSALYGFRDTMVIRVYYHEPTLITTYLHADFPLSNKSYQFNNITTDRSATPLSNLILPTQIVQTPPETPSTLTGHNAYMQPVAGLKIKITFPYLQQLLLRPDFLSILRAQLLVKPKVGTYNNNNYRLPPKLDLYPTDLTNLFGSPLTLNGVAQNGSLVIDYLNPGNTSYTYDLSSYIEQQAGLVGNQYLDDGLILSMPAPANDTSLNRMVLQDRFQAPVDNRVTLRVYYISLKQIQ